MSDRDLIAEGRKLLAAATPGPWWVAATGDIYAGDGSSDSLIVAENPGFRDGELLAWAVSNLPALLDALEAAQRPPADDGESLRIIDRAIWVDHGDGNMDGLTGELPVWADEWAERIVGAVNGQRPPLGMRDIADSTGWHEFISVDKATTHIAYVYEDGSIYFPEGPEVVDRDDFTYAAARGRVYRLMREEAQRPPLGYVTVDLQSENPPSLIEADREIASQQLADDRAASPLGDWVLLEVREVQP